MDDVTAGRARYPTSCVWAVLDPIVSRLPQGEVAGDDFARCDAHSRVRCGYRIGMRRRSDGVMCAASS